MKRQLLSLNSLILSSLLVSTFSFAQPERGDGERSGRGGPPQFSQVDLDADGALTLEEFQNENIPHGDHSELFVMIDADGDGVVTEAEWTDHKPPKKSRRE